MFRHLDDAVFKLTFVVTFNLIMTEHQHPQTSCELRLMIYRNYVPPEAESKVMKFFVLKAVKKKRYFVGILSFMLFLKSKTSCKSNVTVVGV